MYKHQNDYELLYLINNNCYNSVEEMLDKYNPLVWKSVLGHKAYEMPAGVEHNDLYQEGRIALLESFYSYKNLISVPFYSYAKVCIERKLWGYLRKFNSEASKLFYNSLSLDMTVTEDENVYLHEVIAEDQEALSAFVFYREELQALIKDPKDISEFELNVLILKLLGYSYNEIGELLNCSDKKVDNTLQKVKRILSKKK